MNEWVSEWVSEWVNGWMVPATSTHALAHCSLFGPHNLYHATTRCPLSTWRRKTSISRLWRRTAWSPCKKRQFEKLLASQFLVWRRWGCTQGYLHSKSRSLHALQKPAALSLVLFHACIQGIAEMHGTALSFLYAVATTFLITGFYNQCGCSLRWSNPPAFFKASSSAAYTMVNNVLQT